MKGRLDVYGATPDLARGAAERITVLLNDAITSRGVSSFALSGGSTPRAVYEFLGSDEFRLRVDWNRVHLFWGDERCVPQSMLESNYRMVNEALLTKVSIRESNVHRIEGEQKPKDAAMAYEQEIKQLFELKKGQLPEFDVMLLGIGEDGHTASLFPGSAAIQEQTRLVLEVHVEQFSADRITMTFAVINNAVNVLVLVSGRSKASIFQKVLEEENHLYPAQLINPTSGHMHWFADIEAASQLRTLPHL
ncbi:MAG: 6-phosphogluconolactonase [Ignavibacteria bacterium]|nr:6-phosphogluconolactonase [Ignavibacteria bacterium]